VYRARALWHDADASVASAPLESGQRVVTLDHLSNGRVILPIGLGAVDPEDPNNQFAQVGEETDRKVRAQMLDESLDILDGLWSGQPFSYNGEHYHIHDVTFAPTPVQSPRVPIWVVGAWPRMKSMRRVLRCDGVIPARMNEDRSFVEMTPADIVATKAFIDERRSQTTPFDIVMEGEMPGDDPEKAVSIVRPLAEAGVTWWLEAVWSTPQTQGGVEGMRRRGRQGPPHGSTELSFSSQSSSLAHSIPPVKAEVLYTREKPIEDRWLLCSKDSWG
jgi:hypothetical protein